MRTRTSPSGDKRRCRPGRDRRDSSPHRRRRQAPERTPTEHSTVSSVQRNPVWAAAWIRPKRRSSASPTRNSTKPPAATTTAETVRPCWGTHVAWRRRHLTECLVGIRNTDRPLECPLHPGTRCSILRMGRARSARRDLPAGVENRGGPGPVIIGQHLEERALFQALLGDDRVDVGRALGPDNSEPFTGWAPWRNLRQRNIGWRLDDALAAPSSAARARSCVALADFGDCDHAPVMRTRD